MGASDGDAVGVTEEHPTADKMKMEERSSVNTRFLFMDRNPPWIFGISS